MSIVKIPDGFKPLRKTCGVLVDVETICTENVVLIAEFPWTNSIRGVITDASIENWNSTITCMVETSEDEDYCEGIDFIANRSKLFGYGTAGSGYNSRMTWTSTTDFIIDRVEIFTTNQITPIAIGCDPEVCTWTQGYGVCPALGWGSNAGSAIPYDQMFRISANGSSCDEHALPEYTVDDKWWVPPAWPPTTYIRPTLVNFSSTLDALADRVITAESNIDFRIHQLVWRGTSNALPDTIFAPLTIRIYGTPV